MIKLIDILPGLTNDAKRREFVLTTYRAWELVGIVPELELEYFRLTLPSGHQYIAMEYPINYQTGGRDVHYYDVPKGQPFSPNMISAYQLANELGALRQELLKK